MKVVLDSWPVIRFLDGDQPATRLVRQLLADQRPLMSWINLGEVGYVVERLHGAEPAAETIRDLRDVIDVRLPNEATILGAARIKAAHAMSYADAFAAALAIEEHAELWTGDPELMVERAAWRWQDLRDPPPATRRSASS